jgi:hypothetical protein
MGINNLGEMAFTRLDGGKLKASVYDDNSGTTTDLHALLPPQQPPTSTLIVNESRAQDINSFSAVAGYRMKSDRVPAGQRAKLWRKVSGSYQQPVDLHSVVPGASSHTLPWSAAYGLSDTTSQAGSQYTVVGFYRDDFDSGSQAYYWNIASNGAIVSHGTVPMSSGMDYSTAYDISNDGVIVGGEGIFGGDQGGGPGTALFAMMHDLNSGTTTPVPGVQASDGYFTSTATSITDNYVAGYAIDIATNEATAFVYDRNAGTTTTDIMVGPNGMSGQRGPRAIGRAVGERTNLSTTRPFIVGMSETTGTAGDGSEGGFYYDMLGPNPQECDVNDQMTYSGRVEILHGISPNSSFAGGIATQGGARAVFVRDASNRTAGVDFFQRDSQTDSRNFFWFEISDGNVQGADPEGTVVLSNSAGCAANYACPGTSDLSDESGDFLILNGNDFINSVAFTDKQNNPLSAFSYVQAVSNADNACKLSPPQPFDVNSPTVNPVRDDPSYWNDPGLWRDCTGYTGAETDISVDLDHCGACSNACYNDANTVPDCVSSTCIIDQCLNLYEDCNGSAADGCEIDTDTNVNNCGSCGNVCTVANGVPTCDSSDCRIDSCNAPYADCSGGYADGCETNTDESLNNCSGCGIVCSIPNAVTECNGGSCDFVECEPNYYDLNNNLLDGCEYNCTGNPNSYDRPDEALTDSNCDGIDGDIDQAVFAAAAWGNDSNPGTRTSPVRSIGQALTIAANDPNKRQVLLGMTTSSSQYNENVNLVNGVDIAGGFPVNNFNNFNRNTNDEPVINGNAAVGGNVVAMRGTNISSTTYVYQVDVRAGNVSGAINGGSSYGLHCRSCDGLVAEFATFRGGSGSAGNNGGAGGNGSSGGNGGNGGGGDNDGGCCRGGGAGGSSACGRQGGAGGTGGSKDGNNTGGSGASGNFGSAGGGGGGGGCSVSNGGGGQNGSSGSTGGAGDSGNVDNIISGGFWQGESGGNGTAGTHGNGGGGGGGGGGQEGGGWSECLVDDGSGAGGGGGGGGGCRGFGGSGASAGGGSFAVFLSASNGATVRNNALNTANGGNGGSGGNGGFGGSGGGRGFGGNEDEVGDGGNGGVGGSGGRGGGGGGGRGGDTVCIGLHSSSSSSRSGNSCSLGSAGSGGSGGSPNGQGGANGDRTGTKVY